MVFSYRSINTLEIDRKTFFENYKNLEQHDRKQTTIRAKSRSDIFDQNIVNQLVGFTRNFSVPWHSF